MQADNTVLDSEHEYTMLSYAVRGKNYVQKMLDRGVKADWFFNPNARIFFENVRQCHLKYQTSFTKNQFLDKLRNSPTTNPAMLSQYEEFYDGLLDCVYDEEDFPYKLEQFAESVTVLKTGQNLKKYSEELERLGPKDAFFNLCNRLNGIEVAIDKVRQYFISDLEADGCELVADEARKRVENPEEFCGFKTGYRDFDEFFNGFERKRLTLIFGLSSSGKTSFARCCATYIKDEYKANVLFVSCEERREQVIRKIACQQLGISLKRWLRGQLTEEELDKIKQWSDNFHAKLKDREKDGGGWFKVLQLPAGQFSAADIDQIIDRELGNERIDFIVVDHAALLKPIIRHENRKDIELGDSSKYLRELADRRNAAVALLAQAGLNTIRIVKGKRVVDPNIENVQGSSQLYQDSDAVIAIFKDLENKGRVFLRVVKQRDGEADREIALLMDGEYCGFRELDEGALPLDNNRTMNEAQSMKSGGKTLVPIAGGNYLDPTTYQQYTPQQAASLGMTVPQTQAIKGSGPMNFDIPLPPGSAPPAVQTPPPGDIDMGGVFVKEMVDFGKVL